MGKGSFEKTRSPALACIAILGLIITGLAVAVLSINGRQLYDVTTLCSGWSYWYAQCVSVAHTCFASQEPLNDMTPCNYLYSLGAIGLFLQFWIALFSCLMMGMAIGCMAGTSLVSIGWWLAGGIYFTDMFKGIASDIPGDGWRQGIEGVVWSAFGISVLQFGALIFAMKSLKRHGSGGGGDAGGKPQGEMVVVTQNAPMYDAPPPPVGGYNGAPPPPAGYYAAPPPGAYPPAPAGAYPPAPAGAYPPPPAAAV